MRLHIPGLLSGTLLAEVNSRLAAASWTDGRVTAGPQSGAVKNNLQLADLILAWIDKHVEKKPKGS